MCEALHLLRRNIVATRLNLNLPLFSKNMIQGLHRLEKYLNFEGFHEKSLNIKSAFKSTGKSLKSLEKSWNSTIFCRT